MKNVSIHYLEALLSRFAARGAASWDAQRRHGALSRAERAAASIAAF